MMKIPAVVSNLALKTFGARSFRPAGFMSAALFTCPNADGTVKNSDGLAGLVTRPPLRLRVARMGVVSALPAPFPEMRGEFHVRPRRLRRSDARHFPVQRVVAVREFVLVRSSPAPRNA